MNKRFNTRPVAATSRMKSCRKPQKKLDELLAGFVELGYATLSYGGKNLRTRRFFRHQAGRNLFCSPCRNTSKQQAAFAVSRWPSRMCAWLSFLAAQRDTPQTQEEA